jgi:hypothetical protein
MVFVRTGRAGARSDRLPVLASSRGGNTSLLLTRGGDVDEPDWVSWRWLVGLGGALVIVGAWLFGVGDPAWMAVPMLLGAERGGRASGQTPPLAIGQHR